MSDEENVRISQSVAFRRWMMAAIACGSLWMRTGFPLLGIEDSAYDDNLFIKLSRTIGEGKWLGAYDNATLVKGVIYPVFIALAHVLSLPLKTAEQAAYIGACFVVATLLTNRLPRGQILGVIGFALLCFNPTLWYPDMARVLREGLYISLTLLVIGLTTIAAFPPPARKLPAATLMGLFLGLALGAFWNTREEGIALLPAIAVIAACGLAQQGLCRQPGRRLPRIVLPERWLAAAVAACFAFAAVDLSIAAINDRHYGVFETVEVKGAPFTKAYGALVRIKPDHYQRYVVFPKDARDRAYAVSPAARELAPVFEGPFGQQWARVHCAEFGISPCTGVHAGWFQWVLREAVAQAGHYTSAPQAVAYYGRLTSQINAACDQHLLDCLPPRATLSPPFRWSYVGDTWRKTQAIAGLLMDLGSDDRWLDDGGRSRGFLDDISDVVGPVLPAGGQQFKVRGWAAAPQAPPQVQIRPLGFINAATSLNLVSAGDVELAYPGLHAVRFAFDTDCHLSSCELVLSEPGTSDIVVPLAALHTGAMPLDGQTKMFIDSAVHRTTFAATGRLHAFQRELGRRIARAYAAGCRLLLPIACLGLVLAAVLWRRAEVPLMVFALAAGCAAAVLCRLALLAYLDVTTIPFNPPYIMTVSPCLILFVILGLYAGLMTALRRPTR